MGLTERTPRTLLEQQIWQRNQTYPEIAQEISDLATELGERGTISVRHLRGLARGQRLGTSPMTRRLLQGLFKRPIAELLAPPPEDIEDPCTAIATGREKEVLEVAMERSRQFGLASGQVPLTNESVEQIYDDIGHLARVYPQHPLPEIIGKLIEAQELVFGLLDQRLRPAHSRDLHVLAGVVCGLLAKASHDRCDPHMAMTHARTGYICADMAEHPGLRAWIRGLQSLISYWAGRPHDAIRYAKLGADDASAASNSTMVCLPANEARSWAMLGRAEQAGEAIQRAERAWDQFTPDAVDQLGGLCTFGRTKLTYYAADALVWLPDQAQEAERRASQAVEAFKNHNDPEWAFGDESGSRADLAIARTTGGEVEGAAEALRPVLDLPSDQRINGIIGSVQRVYTSLRRSPVSTAAQHLQEEIEMYSRTPLKELPK